MTLAALFTLTLGIGATTAIFSIANGLVLRPLPVRDPQDLVTVTSDTALRHGFQAGAGWSHAMWERLRARADAFDAAFAWTLVRLDLAPGGEMQPVETLVASGELFEALGVGAVVGRPFPPADDVRGGGGDGAVAVISESLWRRRFGGAPDVAGLPLLLERRPVTIIGVAPDRFRGMDVGQPFEVAIPFATDALIRGERAFMNSERALLLTVMLRLKPGQDIAGAASTLRAMQPEIVGPNVPALLKEPFVVVGASRGISDRSRLRQRYLHPLAILSSVSGAVLLIVCLNVGCLLLSRASARRAEMGIRLALGASRWRVARQLLIEALVLGTVGATAGVLFAAWASRALTAQIPLPAGGVSIDLPIDWRVLAFTVGVTVLAVLLFGTAPALHAARVPPLEALRDAGRRGAARSTGPLSGGLVVAQIGLSIVLLAGAGLFVRTLHRLVSVPLGFDPAGVLVMTVNSPPSTAPRHDPARLHQRLLEAISTVPGVTHAAGSLWTPVAAGGGGLLTDAAGRRAEIGGTVAFNFVTPGWFDTYRTPLRTGRDFDTGDGRTAPRVAIVNEALRRSLLTADHPVGATIHAGPCSSGGCTVVGVVADAVYGQSLRDAAPPIVYMPLAQSEGHARPDAPLRLSVRAAGDPLDIRRHLAAGLRSADPRLTFTITSLEQNLAASVAPERLLALLAAFFAASAALLCCVGLYGVSAYAAARRRAEIGIRLALGGPPHVVARAILRRVALLVLAGTAVGVITALWLARFVAPLLYGLAPHDPVTLVAAAAALAAVTGVAAWIPASRAARADPAEVLRQI